MAQNSENNIDGLNLARMMHVFRVRFFPFIFCSVFFFCLVFFISGKSSSNAAASNSPGGTINENSVTAKLLVVPIIQREIIASELGFSENSNSISYGDELIQSREYLEKTISSNIDLSIYEDALGNSYSLKSVKEILSGVDVSVSRTGNIVSISVNDSNADFACDLANLLALNYQERLDEIFEKLKAKDGQVNPLKTEEFGDVLSNSSNMIDFSIQASYEPGKAILIEKAEEKQSDLIQVSTVDNEKMNLVIVVASIIFGLGMGILLLIVLEARDTTIRDYYQLEKFGRMFGSTLGWIPLFKFGFEKKESDLIVHRFKHTNDAELFYRIAERLIRIQNGSQKKVFTFTSTSEGEGKSFITANIGYSMAKAGKRVLLIHEGHIGFGLNNYFGKLEHTKGFSDYILGNQSLETCLTQPRLDVENLYLLDIGETFSMGLLMNPKFDEGIQILRTSFDIILIDAPSAYFSSEVFSLSKYSDEIVIVVRAGVTLSESLKNLVEQLVSFKFSPLFVLNGVIESLANRGGVIRRWSEHSNEIFAIRYGKHDKMQHTRGYGLSLYKKYYKKSLSNR